MIREFKLNLIGTFLGSVSLGLSIFSNISDSLLWAIAGVILIFFNVIWIQWKLGNKSHRKYLSSSFTFVYVAVLPILIVSFGMVFFTMVWLEVIPAAYLQEGVVVVPFLILALWIMFKVKMVTYDSDKLYLLGLGAEQEVSLLEVEDVKRFLIYFYKVDFKEGQSEVFFIPHLIEFMFSFGMRLKSVENFKDLLEADATR